MQGSKDKLSRNHNSTAKFDFNSNDDASSISLGSSLQLPSQKSSREKEEEKAA